MRKKVDVFIIGAQKAGTTTLYEYLNQHPDIYFSEIKESLYFSQEKFYNKGEKYFNSFLSEYDGQKIIASADVQLLPSKKGPARISNYNQKTKLIIILRNPVERAYSAFNFAKQKGEESEDAKFIDKFHNYIKNNGNEKNFREENKAFDYFYDGLYYKHLSHWLAYFNRDQIFLTTIGDLKNSPQLTMSKVFTFLKIKELKINQEIKANSTGTYKLKRIQRLLFNQNSKIAMGVGLFLPQSIKIKLRKNLIQKIRKYLFVKKEFPSLETNSYNQILTYYEKDLKKLKQIFSIEL